MRAARAARLFSLARPIKFLICGVVVAVPVVDAKAPKYDCGTRTCPHRFHVDLENEMLYHKTRMSPPIFSCS